MKMKRLELWKRECGRVAGPLRCDQPARTGRPRETRGGRPDMTRLRTGVFAIAVAVGGCLAALPAFALPAFPGAEGAGANARGGRGGTVFHVTTTNDNGSSSLAGSLRQGVSTGNRTIIFDVSGTFNLASDLKITATNLTIAGQTAPGDGIAIKGWSFIVENTHDVIVRYLRCRPGDVNGTNFQGDAFDFVNATNVIADHISATWSVDECLSPTHFDNVTIQWCVIGESMNKSVHVKGPHGYGSLIKYTDKLVTFHHNLYAHNMSRNPRPGSSVKLDFVNNVAYDWGGFCGYNGDDTAEELAVGGLYFTNVLNYVSNCFVTGPNTGTSHQSNAFDSGVTNALQCGIFQSGNYMDSNRNGVLDGSDTGWSMFTGIFTPLASRYAALPPPSPDNPTTAYERVLAFAGASLARDAADARIIRTVRNHNGCIIDFIGTNSFAGDYLTNNVSGTNYIGVNPWPALVSAPAPLDADQDGMPNYWELNLGLNPNVANNNHTNASGYTDLEDYLNFLGAPHTFGGVNATNFTDLRKMTGGDTNLVFTVAGASNGVVSLAADGITARFLPSTNAIGYASFRFNATNPVNYSAFGPSPVSLFITNAPPVIIGQPANSTNTPGNTATFFVSAANAGLAFQWRCGGTNLVNSGNISGGVTSASLMLTNLVAANAGSYSVVITNFSGAVTSSPAILAIMPGTAPAKLSFTVRGGAIQFSWPRDHTGWRLETQTNNLGTGLNTHWFTVSGSSQTNQMLTPIAPANGTVFFRLTYP